MDAVASITQRLGEIHQRIATLSPQAQAGTAAAASPSGLGTLPGSSSATGSFADMLASATGTASRSSAAGRLNADGVPVDLAAYGNGRIPESALASLHGSGEKMWGPAAESLNQLLRDAAAQGVTIGITDGYRSYEGQVRVAKEKGLYSQGGLAAVPGTSQHGWGMAADLRLDATAQAWMREHAGDYGFVENVPREPWHWEFQPAG